MAMMCGNQNRKRKQHQRGNQPAPPPSILGLRRQLEGLEAPLKPTNRLVTRTWGTRTWCTN
jgi:hypothetical protein